MGKHQGHSKVLFLNRCQTRTKDSVKHPRLLGAVLGLKGEGGSTVVMKRGGILSRDYGLLLTQHQLSFVVRYYCTT